MTVLAMKTGLIPGIMFWLLKPHSYVDVPLFFHVDQNQDTDPAATHHLKAKQLTASCI